MSALGFEEAMQQVLQRPQYDVLTGRAVDFQRAITEALFNAILDFLESLEWAGSPQNAYNLDFMAYAFMVSAGLLLLIASAGITYWLLTRKQRKKRQMRLEESEIFDDIAHKRFTLSALLHYAQECAEKGQIREAVRHHYIAVLVVLNNRRIIQVNKAKTNAQLVKELALAQPEFAEIFNNMVDIFQKSWFGRKHLETEAYQHFVNGLEKIHGKSDTKIEKK